MNATFNQSGSLRDQRVTKEALNLGQNRFYRLRAGLFTKFPTQKAKIQEIFDDYYAQHPKVIHTMPESLSKVDPAALTTQETQEMGLNTQKLPCLAKNPPSFDTLIQKLKEELGAAQVLEFFRDPQTKTMNSDFGQVNGVGKAS